MLNSNASSNLTYAVCEQLSSGYGEVLTETYSVFVIIVWYISHVMGKLTRFFVDMILLGVTPYRADWELGIIKHR